MISELTGEIVYDRIRRNALPLTAVLSTALCLGASPPQQVSPEAARTISIAGRQGQAGFSLRISASNAEGRVEVRDASGTQVQSLTCSLLRDEAHPTSPELEGVRQQFVLNFRSEDLNFDGYPDLKAPREFGAKWGRYCVWLFDPQIRWFAKNDLAEQMELLYNLETDAKHSRVIAYSIGPVNPMRDEYRIEQTSENRPYWPRLIPVKSCFIDSRSKTLASVLTQYDQDPPLIKRQPLNDVTDCTNVCDCVPQAHR